MKIQVTKCSNKKCWYSELPFPMIFEAEELENGLYKIVNHDRYNTNFLVKEDCEAIIGFKIDRLEKPNIFEEQKEFEAKKESLDALRYDDGKPRHDLIPSYSMNELAKIYTMGAKKYSDWNWSKGMKWSRVLGSLKRHLNYFEQGVDFDDESKLHHISHVIWNAVTLLEYYKLAPHLDDRQHNYLKGLRYGFDIDDCLADWCPSFCKIAKIPIPTSWSFGFMDHVNRIIEEGIDYNDFMANLPIKTHPNELPVEPVCYITNRHIDPQIAVDWIKNNGFPQAPVIQTADKVKAAKEMKLDVFVDDKFETFVEMNKAGIVCYLFDCPHNRRYEVGFKRIYSLKELI